MKILKVNEICNAIVILCSLITMYFSIDTIRINKKIIKIYKNGKNK